MDEPISASRPSASEAEVLPLRKLPAESVDDYIKKQGFEPSSVKIDAQYESPDEMRSRLKREEAELTAQLEQEKLDKQHKRRLEIYRFMIREAAAYLVGFVLIGILCATSTQKLVDNTASTEDRAWARTTLASVLTAIAGYIFGKSSAAKEG